MEKCRIKCCRKQESSGLTLLQIEPHGLGLKQESVQCFDHCNFLTYLNYLNLFFCQICFCHKRRCRTVCLKYQWLGCAQASLGRTFLTLMSSFMKQTVFVCFEYFSAKRLGVGQQVATEPSRILQIINNAPPAASSPRTCQTTNMLLTP